MRLMKHRWTYRQQNVPQYVDEESPGNPSRHKEGPSQKALLYVPGHGEVNEGRTDAY